MSPTSAFRLDGADAPDARSRSADARRSDLLQPAPRPSSLASPCVRNCCLNDQDICLGCGRLLSEICNWHQASDAQREEILKLARVRLQRT